MRPILSRSLRTGSAVPHWVLGQFRRLANLQHFITLEEMSEMAQPVWRLPRGVRAAAIVLSLAGLIGGVRVLDAQIAGIADPVTLAGVESESLQVSVSEPMISQPVTTSPPPNVMIVESLPKGDTHRFLMVKVTGYTSGKGSADEAAPLTAVSRHPRPGTIALSRDLLRNFTPGAPFSFGDRVVVPGMGIYVVEDTMHPEVDPQSGHLVRGREYRSPVGQSRGLHHAHQPR